jgi:CheY-like chemotaxis protein
VKDEDHALVDMVESCAKRGAQIIRQLLTYARGQPETRLQLPVRHLLREMETIMAETFPKNIGTSVAVSPDLWPVLADITQVQQAVMNLCVNARDAMPEGGCLKLAAANAAVDETFEDAVPDAKPGPYVCLSVADSGMGIPAHHLEKIFDPFFTTKEIGKGTGLGLATVLGIARGHAGFVRVRSREGAGAVFEIYLPAAPLAPDPDGTAPGNRALKPRGAGELVLVVDDERAVTRTAQLTLQQHGYTVLVAQDGVEALAIYAQQHAAIKAVVTDMMMPGMDGPTLVQNLQRLDPRLPIVGMTGLHDDETVAHLAKFGLISLLAKPCTAPELLQALERALALGPSTADSGPGRIGGG